MQSDGTPNGEARTVSARHGGRYVFVRTGLHNDTSGRIDLTCGFLVDAKQFDTEARSFDPIDGLSQIRGNRTATTCCSPASAPT